MCSCFFPPQPTGCGLFLHRCYNYGVKKKRFFFNSSPLRNRMSPVFVTANFVFCCWTEDEMFLQQPWQHQKKQVSKQTKMRKEGERNVSSPGVSTLLLTVRLTCPLRAAACIKSITYLCGFPATTFLSTEMSSSPGRSRPSRSAGVFSIMAPITICSKTINISSAMEGEEIKKMTE